MNDDLLETVNIYESDSEEDDDELHDEMPAFDYCHALHHIHALTDGEKQKVEEDLELLTGESIYP